MNVRFALAAVAVLILSGCAITSRGPLPAPPPVKVVIIAAPSLAKVIDVAKTTAQTEWALRRYASAAAPATVTVHLDGLTLTNGAAMTGVAMHGGAVPATYVSRDGVFSLTGWPEGFIPTTYSMPEGMRVDGSELAVSGTYTITDESGAMLGEWPLFAPTGKNQEALARLIAVRVAQLARPRKRS